MVKKKVKTLAEKVDEQLAVKQLYDPEDDSGDETAAKNVEHDVDYDESAFAGQLSEFRKRNATLLHDVDKKYRGKLTSRKQMDDEDDEMDSDDEQEDDSEDIDSDAVEDLKEFQNKIKQVKNGNVSEEDEAELSRSEDESDSYEDSDEDDGKVAKESVNEIDSSENENELSDNDENSVDDRNASEGSHNSDTDESDFDYEAMNQLDGKIPELDDVGFVFSAKPDAQKDVNKGLSVQNQIQIWDKLLEMRIHLQQTITKSNELPNPQLFSEFKTHVSSFSAAVNEVQINVTSLLENMIEMQQTLVKRFSETSNLQKDRRGKKRDFATMLEQDYKTYAPYRDSVLQKWHERTKVLSATKSNNQGFDILQNIKACVDNRLDKLKKSQPAKWNERNRHEEPVSGDDEPLVDPTEVYDDTDFYHHQLRELIESKTNNLDTPMEMTKQFIELQKLRNKMKKKTDTRASKGRKIRYVVHNKLVNFTAPNVHCDWTEEAKDELYSSLFGNKNVAMK